MTIQKTFIDNQTLMASDIAEIVTSINSNETNINTVSSNKVDKVSGKGLSTNDYSSVEQTKLSSVATGATKVASSTTNGNIKINGTETPVYTHPGTGTNPHGTTKADVSLGNVPNVDTNSQTPTYTEASTLETISSGEYLTIAFGKIKKAINSLIGHIANVANPHGVTKSQVGLGSVDNTSDLNKPVSTVQQNALNLKANSSQVLTNVPANAIFTDTVTSVNGKTGAIAKADIVALGIPAPEDVQGQIDNKFDKNPIQFANGDNLDNFITTGLYGSGYSTVIKSLINAPDIINGGECQLKVESLAFTGYVYQTFTLNISSTTIRQYIRRHSTSWGDWEKIYTSGNKPTLAELGITTPTVYAPTLQNSWINYGITITGVGYYKDIEGVVHLRGLIKNGTTTNPTLLFTLPEGFRPLLSVITTAKTTNGTNLALAQINIGSDGTVYICTNSGYNSWLSLEGIVFDTF